jgi:hypothetical protein
VYSYTGAADDAGLNILNYIKISDQPVYIEKMYGDERMES